MAELVVEEKSLSLKCTQENNKKSGDWNRLKAERGIGTLHEVDEKNFYDGECTLVELTEGNRIGPRCTRCVTCMM